MTYSKLTKFTNAAGRILLAWIFVVSQFAAAQNQTANDQPLKGNASATVKSATSVAQAEDGEEGSPRAAAQEAGSNGAPHDSIKVHGHWTIEVRNPDGSLVTHREFENSYIQGTSGPGGPGILPVILAHSFSVGLWIVELDGGLCPGSQVPGSCIAAEPNPAVNPLPAGWFPTLTITTHGRPDTLVFAGNVTAQASASISSVSTSVGLCPPGTAPAACTGEGGRTFTATTFTGGGSNPPISVAQGQLVQVTVVVSFS